MTSLRVVATHQPEDQVDILHVFGRRATGSPVDDLEAESAILESEYSDSIDASIEAWTGSGLPPKISPTAEAWLRLRFLAALGILSDSLPRKDSFFDRLPKSDMSDVEILKWMTTDLWRDEGRRWLAAANL